MPRISVKLSFFGYIAAIVYALMAIIMMHMQSAYHDTSHGLHAHLLRPGVSLIKGPWIDALLIQVRPARQQRQPRFDERPDLYFGPRLVRWDDFDFALQQEIRRRPLNWPVYVQGERDLDWNWIARVIDKVRGSQSEVVLLTRRSTPTGKQSTSVVAREISTKVR